MMKQFFMHPYQWVILVTGVILLACAIAYLTRSRWRPNKETQERKSPLDILEERYAKGEIGREEFENKKKELE